MSQREFPFLGSMPAPTDAPSSALSMCQSESEALLVALSNRGKRTRSWFAKALGISRSYFSEITSGTKAIPDWMIVPICVLTGTNILAQYRDLQRALRMVKQAESEASRIERITRELRRVA
jgi:hypothetical protein